MIGRAACVALLAFATPVHGDSLEATRAQPIRELSHTVEIRVADGVATYVVQRTFENRGSRADQIRLAITLPTGAAATGLRIRAKTRWHTGELLERAVAAARYQELTGVGAYAPKDPALLYWESSTELGLSMFPVMPHTVSTVEYTLTVPTEYRAGRYQLAYPRALHVEPDDGAIQLVAPAITVNGAAAELDGKPLHGRKSLAAPRADDDLLAAITVAPPAIHAWQGRLARVVASPPHAFSRLELDTAPQISAVPRGAQVVFVIDASHSAGPELIESELAIARAYARHVPDAQIELVVYRRTAKRVFGTFVAATGLAAAIDGAMHRGVFAPGNGSALDDGARLAATILATRTGPRRIVLFTDELVREALSDADALAALAGADPAAVVHVVHPDLAATDAAFTRDDDATFAPLAMRHHGVFARLGVHGGDAALAGSALELVRPIRIEHLAIDTPKLTVVDTLREGEGVRVFEALSAADAPARVKLTGQLWSDPVTLAVGDTAPFARATAGFVFGADMHSQLSPTEMMTVARAGRAVSPVTSYLAIEPGVRPSTEGLERGGTGWGSIGSGSYGTIGHGVSVSMPPRPDLAAMVDTSRCPSHAPVKLVVETTNDEIVDVTTANAADPVTSCLVEAAWQVRLDGRFTNVRDRFPIEL